MVCHKTGYGTEKTQKMKAMNRMMEMIVALMTTITTMAVRITAVRMTMPTTVIRKYIRRMIGDPIQTKKSFIYED